MVDCVFCKIASGKIPCAKLYEDSKTLAFLDISPVHPGHTLVISKTHVGTYDALSAADRDALGLTLQKVAHAVGTLGDGYNIMQNNGKAAGQLVMHVHFHVIPRFTNDGLHFDWPQQSYKQGEMEKVATRLQNLLSA